MAHEELEEEVGVCHLSSGPKRSEPLPLSRILCFVSSDAKFKSKCYTFSLKILYYRPRQESLFWAEATVVWGRWIWIICDLAKLTIATRPSCKHSRAVGSVSVSGLYSMPGCIGCPEKYNAELSKMRVTLHGLLSLTRADNKPSGCFCKLEARFLGVLRIRALLFWVCVRAPDFWKLPFGFLDKQVCSRLGTLQESIHLILRARIDS